MIPILLITFVGIALRLISLNQSFWLDEATTWLFSSMRLSDFFVAIRGDFHPPLYYLLVRLFPTLGSNQEWLIRLPSVIISSLAIILIYQLLIDLRQSKVIALTTAALLAVNPLHIYYSQELRMYGIATVLTIGSWIMLLRKNNKWFVLLSLLNLYTFYGSLFIFISQLVYLVIQKESAKKIFFLSLAVFIALVPWLSILSVQLYGGHYLTTALQGWSNLSGNLSLKSLVLIPVKFSLGRISISPQPFYFLVAALITTYTSLLILLGIKKNTQPLVIWMITPLILSLAISIFTPVLGYWRLLPILPGFIALMVIGIFQFPQWAAIANIVILFTIFLCSDYIYWTNPKFHREDWRSFSQQVATTPQSLVVINFSGVFAPLKFYLPNQTIYPTQSSLGKVKTSLDQDLSQIPPQTPIFVMDYLSDLTDPTREVSKWFNRAGFKQIKIYNFTNLGYVYEYQTP